MKHSSFQLTDSLLSIRIDSAVQPRLVKIPAESIVERSKTLRPTPGFAVVLWRGSRYVVFEEDLERQSRTTELPQPCART
jgi:hypothetical protein